jgi:UDP-3-O-[3-hydroxymyristoyl] glucosamine N-acyltransferase
MKKIIIFGTGELAQRIFFYLQDSDDQVIAFCANKSKIDKDELLGLPVHAFENIEEKFPPNEFSMFIALAYSEMNKKRTKFFNEAKKKGYELYSYIHPSTKIWNNTSIGDNCFITSNVTMGGHIVMGKNCFVGLSSTINQRIKIGNECIIGAGTIISKNTNDNEVYAVNSSKKLPQSSDQISDMI